MVNTKSLHFKDTIFHLKNTFSMFYEFIRLKMLFVIITCLNINNLDNFMTNLVISVLAGYWAGIQDQWFQIKEKLANYHLEKKKSSQRKASYIKICENFIDSRFFLHSSFFNLTCENTSDLHVLVQQNCFFDSEDVKGQGHSENCISFVTTNKQLTQSQVS